MGNKNVKIRILIVAIAALVVVAVVGFVAYSNSPAQRLKAKLELGQKYLTELDYEQAVAVFKEAIEIEPGSQEALSGLSQAYVKWSQSKVDASDYEKAVSIMAQARADLPDDPDVLEQYVQAYINWAEYYGGNGDYDNAIKVAKEGYEKTGDGRLQDCQNKYEQILLEAKKKAEMDEYLSKPEIKEIFALIDAEDYEGACNYICSLDLPGVLGDVPENCIFTEGGYDSDLTGKGHGIYCKVEDYYLFYSGDYSEGQRAGQGVLYFADRDVMMAGNNNYRVYSGSFEKDKANGYGEVTVQNLGLLDRRHTKIGITRGYYKDWLENGELSSEIHFFDDRTETIHYSSIEGVRQDLGPQVDYVPKDGSYVYARADEGGIFIVKPGDIYDVLQIGGVDRY